MSTDAAKPHRGVGQRVSCDAVPAAQCCRHRRRWCFTARGSLWVLGPPVVAYPAAGAWGCSPEESDHFGGRVRALLVGVTAGRVAAGPGVPGALHQPGFGDDAAVPVGVHGPGVPGGHRRRPGW